MESLLRRLPKVDQLLEEPALRTWLDRLPRALVLKAIRQTLDDLRAGILAGSDPDPELLERAGILAEIQRRVAEFARPNFRRVVNGTGVIIHTNLGRSPMPEEALEALLVAGRHYGNLEYDLAGGRRGSRYSHVEGLLRDLTGAEAALVVNNNAAAVLVALRALAAGREVIVSRGELVEIGGSFRIPEVMAQSGAILVEVGATNKTHPRDYEQAIGERTALLLKVHQSNFRIVGFTTQVEAKDLVALAARTGLPVMEDLGSGSLVDLSAHGLRQEPTVRQTVAAGVDVTTFSGDKLLGGPQAGIIVGRRDHLELIKNNPLNRALRIDKFTLAALEAVLRLYLDEKVALERIPTLHMIAAPYARLRRKAGRLARRLESIAGELVAVGDRDGFSQIGGGALPTQDLRTRLVTLRPRTVSVNALEAWLRTRPTPVIGRIEDETLVLDVRTMDDNDFDLVGQALAGLAPTPDKGGGA